LSTGVAAHIHELRRVTDRRGDLKNMGLVGVQLGVHIYLLFALPLLLTHNAWWGLTLALAALVPIPMWILAHEAVHGSLHRSRVINDLLGRLLASLCYAAPFELMRIGHLLHHKNNAYGQIQVDPRQPKRWGWYANYYAGLFLQPVAPLLLSNVLAVLPLRRVLPLARRLAGPALLARATEPRASARMRWDGLTTLVVMVGSAICWRAHPLGLILIYALRCALISFDDSVYHFQGPSDLQHGYNLRVPRGLTWLFLGFNYHGVHHLNAGLRWRQLAPTFAGAGLAYDGSYVAVAMSQLRPLSPLALKHRGEAPPP